MDRENGIWTGTYFGGINYLSSDHNYFDKYFPTNTPGSLSGNAVREFQEDASGNLWIGTEDNGLNYFNPHTGKFRSYSPSDSNLSYHNIHGLLLDGDKLFIGYFMNGMDVYDLRTLRVRNYKSAGTATSLSDNNVFAIHRDSRGSYWVGTIAGLNLFDPDKGVFTRVHEVGTHAFIYDLLEDSRGIIWVATYYTGVFSYNPRSRRWINYVHIPGDSTSLGYNKTISLSEDSRGNIWIATEGGGVSVYSPEEDKFRTYTVLDGLPNNVVHKALEDEYGKIWISTNNGLAVFDPKNEDFQTYTHNKGLMSNQFNYKSGIKTSDGRLYFGSIQGMVGFDPLRQFPNRMAPPVVLTRFDLFNREVAPSDENSPLDCSVTYGQGVTLTHRQSSFSFEFAALSYNASEMNRYAYRLEGLEEEWNYICGNQRVSYSNVPHGSYVFRVRGANSDGLWNNEGASMPIRIKPPFRSSVIGIVLESLLGISLVLVVVLFYHHKIKQKHQRIVDELKAAEDIALQKAKMSFFTNMTHEIRTPLSLIWAPFEQISKIDTDNEDMAENLKIMGSNINRLLNLTNELLDFSKVENRGFSLRMRVADIGELINNTLTGFGQIVRDKELKLELLLPRNPIVTHADAEILSKIFINLMSNATKFAERRITVALADNIPDERFFQVTIANDGEHISPESRDDIFKAFFQERRGDALAGTGLGLPLVKQLVELHGGQIYIDPHAESENRFVVEIPKADESTRQEALAEADEESYCSDAEQPHIIIAEDESTMRQFLSKSLSKYYRITTCADGQEVLDVLKHQPADLILTDLVMPKMDGLHLCNILKTELEYCHIPVIILTARANVESEIEVLDSGADAYIEKPFSLEHLQTRIANLLTKVHRLREAFRNNPDTPAGSIATNATDEAFIGRITDIILEHNEDDDFSIDRLAEVMNISRSSLYRKIKGVSQLPPNEFIRLCKLRRAADLLNEGTFRINEICYLVGFNSPSYFAKCFQKQFGVSPKDYAKRHR